MNSISSCFQSLRERQQCALIPFITAGDPDLTTTSAVLQLFDRNGADLIELGVPYSDPLADGPVIQAAATRALQRGIQLDQILKMLMTLRPTLKAPLILFTYYNPILNRGLGLFLKQISEAGVQGLVVPDLPFEESNPLFQAASKVGVELILLVAPNTPSDRIEAISRQSQGFIYLVSVTGVTGVRTELHLRTKAVLNNLQNLSSKPIGIGFGISQAEQARQLKEWGADAVIVGSAFTKQLASDASEDGLKAMGEFCRSLKAAISN
jgi:tryptophan synthase alpha chain